MTRSLYGEPDYVFGQRMLTLRTSIGLTQEGLAGMLGITRKAIGRWEAGETYPKATHLQALLALAVQQGAFVAGEEEEEIRAFWRAAHQKVQIDDAWLHELLRKPAPSRLSAPGEQNRTAERLNVPSSRSKMREGWGEALDVPSSSNKPQVDWREALDVPNFYGRREELAVLDRWIGEERCRVVSVLGMGGIGKSALAVTVMYQVASQFEVVIWRSLRDMPNCATLLKSCLQTLDPHVSLEVSDAQEELLRRLMEHLRTRRVLLVLDNLETLLDEGTSAGRLRADAQGYGQFLRHLGETRHQSCLLLTSREKLAELVPLEGKRSPVRALRLTGLDGQAGAELLEEKEIAGSHQDLERLVKLYQGNPLALKIVGQTIAEIFGGEIVRFLEQGELIFGGVRELLNEQFDRLSVLGQHVFCWLALLREPVNLEDLLAVLFPALDSAQVLEVLNRLLHRSLIERGQQPGSFMLQSVVLEYATGRLIAEVTREIEQGRLTSLISYGLCQAQAKEYVRQIQERLLVVALLNRLRSMYQKQTDLEARLRSLLDDLRRIPLQSQGYGPANLVALLRVLRGDLRGLDLSRLALRGVYLQGVEMQDTTLAGAALRGSVFTESFDAITWVAISPDGQYWATGSQRGEVRLWRVEREAGQILRLAWQAHMDKVMALAFSPDGRTLASGSLDGTVKLWDVESGTLLWTVWHVNSVISLAFTSDGGTLASAGNEPIIRLWDTKLGTALENLPHPGPVFALAWSHDDRLLASGGFDGAIRLWQRQQNGPASCVQTLAGHTNWVRGLAFAPDGNRLASASWDGTVKLWNTESGYCLDTLTGHTERVHCVAWSPDGATLASSGIDPTIWLWDVESRSARAVLQGHSATVNGLIFTPDSRSLLSGSDDGTLRLWDTQRGEALRVMKGYAVGLYDVAWSPNGTQLASTGSDSLVTVWEMGRKEAMPPTVLSGHRWMVYGVSWSPDGSLVASSGWDNAIRLWDPTTGNCVQILRDLDIPDTLFWGVAWSPDGSMLASGTYRQGVQVWDMKTRSPRWADRAHSTWVRRVAWSPDGTRLIGGDEDGYVYVWDASNGTLLHRLPGHSGAIMSVAWSPDGSRLATGAGFGHRGELMVWDVLSGVHVRDFAGQRGAVTAVAWDFSGEQLISGGSDGRLRWWNVESGMCVQAHQAHQGTVQALKPSSDGKMLASCGEDGAITLWDLRSGRLLQTLRRDRPYERLNITGIQGISEAQKASLQALGAFEERTL